MHERQDTGGFSSRDLPHQTLHSAVLNADSDSFRGLLDYLIGLSWTDCVQMLRNNLQIRTVLAFSEFAETTINGIDGSNAWRCGILQGMHQNFMRLDELLHQSLEGPRDEKLLKETLVVLHLADDILACRVDSFEAPQSNVGGGAGGEA